MPHAYNIIIVVSVLYVLRCSLILLDAMYAYVCHMLIWNDNATEISHRSATMQQSIFSDYFAGLEPVTDTVSSVLDRV